MRRISPFTIAEEMLQNADQAGLTRTSAPLGPQTMAAPSPYTDVRAADDAQAYNNNRMMEQNINQNTSTAMQQAGANAKRDVQKQQLALDNQEYKANALFTQRTGEVLSMMNSPATLAMGNMSPPQMAAFRADIATGKAMAMGVNPDLVMNQVNEQRYG